MSQIKNLFSSSSSSFLAAHCTAPPILNNSDFLRVISTDLSPHFNYNLRLDLLLLHFWVCAFSLWQLEQSMIHSQNSRELGDFRNELQWRWIWGTIDDDSCCAGAWRFPERTAVAVDSRHHRRRQLQRENGRERQIDGSRSWFQDLDGWTGPWLSGRQRTDGQTNNAINKEDWLSSPITYDLATINTMTGS